MACNPFLYSEYASPVDYTELLAAMMAGEGDAATAPSSSSALTSSGGAMWGDENCLYPMFDSGAQNTNNNSILSQEPDIVSSAPVMNFHEGIGMMDSARMAAFSDYNITGPRCSMDQINGGGFLNDACKLGDENCGFVQDFKPENGAAEENWRVQRNMPVIEESNIKVGRYSVEERKDRIMRYLDKRNRRNFNKTIKYACRKTLADRRVRIRGRFARNNEICEEEMLMKKKSDSTNKNDLCYRDSAQIAIDEENCWLQEMMGSLFYLPYLTG